MSVKTLKPENIKIWKKKSTLSIMKLLKGEHRNLPKQ